MNTPKSNDRIPFETLDETSVVSAWDLPSVAVNSRLVRSAKRDKDKSDSRKDEKIETVKKNKRSKPLTVEELAEITETARREGFEQGLREGTEQGIREGTKVGEKTGQQRAYLESKKEIENLQNQLRQIAVRLFEPMEKQDRAVENILVDLALNLSKHIVASEIKTDPMIVLNMVKHVLQDLPKSETRTCISMCDDDADALEKLIPPAQRQWEVHRDNTLSSGGCVVETDASFVDFSVESRLTNYLEALEKSSDKNDEPVPDYHALHEDEDVKNSEALAETDIKDSLDSKSATNNNVNADDG